MLETLETPPDYFYDIQRNPVTAVGLSLALGFLCASGTNDVVSGTWYRDLSVPPGGPPRRALPFIWTTMHAAMGYASHLAIRHHDSAVSCVIKDIIRAGHVWYYRQWVFNLGKKSIISIAETPLMVFCHTVALAGLTLYMTKLFHDGTDGATTPFLIPYCAWACVGVYIDGGIYWFNRGRDLPPDFD